MPYKQILKEKKKWIIISSLILIFSFFIGLKFPNLIPGYTQKIVQGLLESIGTRTEIISFKIIITNIEAALLGIVLGVLLIPTLLLSFLNGYIFGAVTSNALANFSLEGVLLRIVPHGILEIPAVIISYALGISIGLTLINCFIKKENTKTIFSKIAREYKNSFLVFLFVVLPLIIIAGIIEGVLFKYQNFIIGNTKLEFIFYSLILLYLFYFVLKLTVFYRQRRDVKLLAIVSFLVLIASALWTRAYGLRIKILLENFGVIITVIPLLILLFYTYWENQRFKEQSAKKQIKDAFQQYMSPAVIEELLKHPEKLKLGGEKKELTIFFSDIRSFATISEKFSPEKLVSVLNQYLSAMTEIIIKNNGVIDKYIGDEIMAFWNAPLDEPRHPALACSSALEMTKKLKELNSKWKKEGIEEIKIGMGINTGEAIVGNMGSSQRFNYTTMGDNVNIASRLESLNKVYGSPIIISESTYEKIKDYFICRELDFVMVKGRKEPTKIYELICKKEDETKDIKKFTELFENGLDKYRKAKWEDAINYFQKCCQLNKDKASEVFISRCKEFKKSNIKKWDGIFEQKQK